MCEALCQSSEELGTHWLQSREEFHINLVHWCEMIKILDVYIDLHDFAEIGASRFQYRCQVFECLRLDETSPFISAFCNRSLKETYSLTFDSTAHKLHCVFIKPYIPRAEDKSVCFDCLGEDREWFRCLRSAYFSDGRHPLRKLRFACVTM
jgi:hypothetical protein